MADAYDAAVPVLGSSAALGQEELRAIKTAITGNVPLAANRISKVPMYNSAGTAIELVDIGEHLRTVEVSGVAAGTLPPRRVTVVHGIAGLENSIVHCSSYYTTSGADRKSMDFETLNATTIQFVSSNDGIDNPDGKTIRICITYKL